jgi:hypothetical protein
MPAKRIIWLFAISVTVGIGVLTWREYPALKREINILRM